MYHPGIGARWSLRGSVDYKSKYPNTCVDVIFSELHEMS